MSNPSKPASRMGRIRATSWYPPLAYYGGLFMAAPRLFSKAASSVAQWVSILVLVAAVAGVTISLSQQAYQLAGLIVAVVALVGFLRLNYQEVAKLRRRVVSFQQEYMFDKFHYGLIDDLVRRDGIGQLWGYVELVRKLDRGEGASAELVAEFDAWDAHVAQHVGLIDKTEVEFLQRPVEPSAMNGDWRERFRTLLEVRKSRIEAIHVRQKVRYDGKVAERKRKEAARK